MKKLIITEEEKMRIKNLYLIKEDEVDPLSVFLNAAKERLKQSGLVPDEKNDNEEEDETETEEDETTSEEISSDKLSSPLKKTKFPTGNYGVYRKGLDKPGTTHPGIDLRAAAGSELFAPGDGKVSAAVIGKDACGGKIRINHSNGLTSSFCHLSGVFVKPGDVVKQGDKIGLTGGQPGTIGAGYSTAPHLHWEIRKGNNLVDPIKYVVQKFYDKNSKKLSTI